MKIESIIDKINYRIWKIIIEKKVEMPQIILKEKSKEAGTLGIEVKGEAIQIFLPEHENDEREIINTVVHEIVHYYLDIQGFEESNQHGPIFQEFMQKIFDEPAIWREIQIKPYYNLESKKENTQGE